MPELRPSLPGSEEPQPQGQREYGPEGSSPMSLEETSQVSGLDEAYFGAKCSVSLG